MKNEELLIENKKYIIQLKILNDSLMIIIKKENNEKDIYERNFSYEEIYEINEKYKECNNKDDLLNLIYNDFILNEKKNIKIDSNYLIINNHNLKKEIKLEKIKLNEDDIIDDIFNKLSSLENQINQFTEEGQKLSYNLQNNLEQVENIIKNNKK